MWVWQVFGMWTVANFRGLNRFLFSKFFVELSRFNGILCRVSSNPAAISSELIGAFMAHTRTAIGRASIPNSKGCICTLTTRERGVLYNHNRNGRLQILHLRDFMSYHTHQPLYQHYNTPFKSRLIHRPLG